MELFVYSTAKGQRTYHTEQCVYARRIAEGHRGYFSTIEKAEAAGYHACQRCSRLGKAYTREKKKIQEFCRKAHFTCFFKKGRVAIQTPVDRWLLLYDPAAGKVLTYHQSHSSRVEKSRIKGYHNQKWAYHSIYETLLSIFDHTQAYLKKNSVPGHVKSEIYRAYGSTVPPPLSRRNRNKRARKEKEEAKRHQIGHVLDLIGYLAAKREKENK